MRRGARYTPSVALLIIRDEAAFFLTRIKSNTRYRRLYSRPVDQYLGLCCDETIVLTEFYACCDYPDKLRLVKYVDSDAGKRLREDRKSVLDGNKIERT